MPASIDPDAAILAASLRLLTTVEELAPNATGCLSFGDRGRILVQQRRICWAVASGMNRRLTGLLRRQSNPPLSRTLIEDVLRKAKRDGEHFGEALVRSGHVTEDGLRRSLFEHTNEVLAHIALAGVPSTGFAAHTGRGYDPRFVFSTTSLFAAMGAWTNPAKAAAARGRLDDVLVPGSSGMAFLREGGGSLPVMIAATTDAAMRVTEAIDLCSWSSGVFDLTSAFDSEARVVIGRWRGGRAVVGWRQADVSYVAPCETTAAMALLASRLDGLSNE